MTDKPELTVRLPEHLLAALSLRALREEVPLHELVVDLLDERERAPRGVECVAVPVDVYERLASGARRHDMTPEAFAAMIVNIATGPWLDGDRCPMCASRETRETSREAVQTLEGILRSEMFDREDPAAQALFDHLVRADPATVAAIVWHLSFQGERGSGRPIHIGARTRNTIVTYPAIADSEEPRRLLARLLASAAADLYQWLVAVLQKHPSCRSEIEGELIAHGYTDLEVDAAQTAVMLPHEYFERRLGMEESDRRTAVRSYALEQGIAI
jgi:hypothetical protein